MKLELETSPATSAPAPDGSEEGVVLVWRDDEDDQEPTRPIGLLCGWEHLVGHA
jgi:hypothetical protein